MDGAVMKLSIAVIISVLAYFVWTWWQGRNESIVASKTENLDATPSADIPKGPGITMYGTDGCPWCVKQKDYFKEKSIDYTFKDCDKGECPSFVTGYPTIVKDGQVMPGYQEL
jgi:hypothetical protein